MRSRRYLIKLLLTAAAAAAVAGGVQAAPPAPEVGSIDLGKASPMNPFAASGRAGAASVGPDVFQRAVDARAAYQGVPASAGLAAVDDYFRDPGTGIYPDDRRGVIRGTGAVEIVPASVDNGFDWGDFAIGVGVGLGALLILLGLGTGVLAARGHVLRPRPVAGR
jgi:hypothetical protein